jgi:DNA-binding NarL/FixJ family response regulator
MDARGRRAVRVLLVDDHALFREGIAEILTAEGGVEVVGEASDGLEAVELARTRRPEVVLLDVQMPVMGGEEAIGPILEASPSSQVVVLTMHDDARLVRSMIARGARAYVGKNATREELVAAVRAAASGERRVVLSLSHDAAEKLQGGAEAPLTARELEIVLLAARGMSNYQIASSLRLVEGTVKRHLSNVYRKLGVGSRGEATRVALSEGWITATEVAEWPRGRVRRGGA